MAMIDDQAQIRVIYDKQRKVTYTNVFQLFELNFNKIYRLVPLLPSIKENHIALKDSLNKLHLICHNKSPYTGTFTLTHRNALDRRQVNKPDIRFKLYFDAHLLEVLSIYDEGRINKSHPLKNHCSDYDFQWKLNLFMMRWLDYCLGKYAGAEWQKRN